MEEKLKPFCTAKRLPSLFSLHSRIILSSSYMEVAKKVIKGNKGNV